MDTSSPTSSLLRRIPAIDRLLASAGFPPLVESYPRERVIEAVREVLEALRREIAAGTAGEADLAPQVLSARVADRLAARFAPYYRRVINATGVVLHTNLGRAPLAETVARELAHAATGAQRLEMDVETGERGGRDQGCARLLTELTGAAAATVVNNNAAATLLLLAALARGKKVLVSRGELVEIGGSYRVPDVMRESGAVLAEVGTTNRTHRRDYEQAIDDETGLILKVHTSNYRVIGFTKEVEIPELVEIGRSHGIPVVHDVGSGSLIDLARYDRPGESPVQESIAAGVDALCFSGDKLLGGPQAGIIVGTAEAVGRCRKHPLFRAMRPGRLIYTALEATLKLYLMGEETAVDEVPALARLTAPLPVLRERARRLAERLSEVGTLEASIVACQSQAGSGSLPAREYESRAVRLTPVGASLDHLNAFLRRGEPPVVGRTQDDALLLDMRTVTDDEAEAIAAKLVRYTASP